MANSGCGAGASGGLRASTKRRGAPGAFRGPPTGKGFRPTRRSRTQPAWDGNPEGKWDSRNSLLRGAGREWGDRLTVRFPVFCSHGRRADLMETGRRFSPGKQGPKRTGFPIRCAHFCAYLRARTFVPTELFPMKPGVFEVGAGEGNRTLATIHLFKSKSSLVYSIS